MTGANSWASEYFRQKDTVVEWWDPLSPADPAYQQWFLAQQRDLLGVAPVKGKAVLDAGTGRGRMAIAAALNGAARVVGVDVSADMLDRARAAASQAAVTIELRQGDLESLPVENCLVDVAYLLEILLHLPRPEDVLREIHRALKPNGLLLVTTVGANPVARLLQPDKSGASPASRSTLAGATAVNLMMSTLFGFTWGRTGPTAALYKRFFNAPVRPLPPVLVRRMLAAAGFDPVYHEAVGPMLAPREHRWLAVRSEL